jgi:hypothetical protein
MQLLQKTKRDANIHEQGGRGGGRGRGHGHRGGGRGGGREHPAPGCGSDTHSLTSRADLVYTMVTGPNMAMKYNMIFKPEEWNKLTPAQKSKLRAAKELPPKPSPTPETAQPALQIHATDLQTKNVAASPTVPAPNDSQLRQVLSNRTVRTSGSEKQPSYIQWSNLPTHYQHCQCFLSAPHASRRIHQDSLIDGGANGGMSGCVCTSH